MSLFGQGYMHKSQENYCIDFGTQNMADSGIMETTVEYTEWHSKYVSIM